MKKSSLYSIIFALIYWVPSISFSQSFRFKNYGVNDGLPSSETYHVMQDSKGYIWVSSDMGVSRFNGYEFQNFSTKDGLPDNVIFESYEDHKGRIWFRSISGKLSYYYNDSINNFPVNDELFEQLNKGIIYSMAVDQYDTLWLGIYRGLGPIKISLNDLKITRMKINAKHYTIDVSPKQVIFGDMYTDVPDPFEKIKIKDQELLFYNYDRNLEHQRSFSLGIETLFYNAGGIRSIALADENKRYIAHTSKCAMIENNKVLSSIAYKASVNALHYSEGVWVCVLGDGVYYYPDGDITGNPALHLFKGKTVSSVYRGAEGGYFFSTTADGLFYTPNIALVNYDASNKLTENRIQAVLPTSPNIWLGYYHSDGVDIISDSTVRKKEIVLKSGRIGDVNTILKHSDGTVWVSSTSGVSVFSGNQPFDAIAAPGEYANKAIGMAEADSGYVWFIGLNHLSLVKRNGNRIELYKIFVSKSRLSCVHVTKNHKVYVGTAKGILQYKTDSLVQAEGLDVPQLKTKIISIKENSKGQLFIATKESGIFIKSENELIQIGQEQGMLSGVCRSLFVDSLDNIWVGTNMGLSRIKQKETGTGFQVTNYTEKGGLASNEVNDIKVFAGKVYAATNGGLTIFNSDKKLSNEVPPPVYITGIHIHNETKILQSSYELKYDQNFLIVDYIGLTYKDAGNVQYRYQLTGVDTNWVYTKYRTVQYPTLPPGRYTFSVAAMNNDGVWSNTPATFNLHISPPWWETWWFRLSVLLAVAGFIYWRIKTIEKREQEKTELNKQVSEMELKALRAQMNPHFIFNAINSIQHFIILNEQEDAHKYLTKFSKLIRNVLDNSRKPLITVEHELETINLYMELEALRFEEGNKFTYKIELDDKLDAHEIEIPSMLIQPYIENAIWHGLAHLNRNAFLRQGSILVRIEEVNHNLIKCIIQDNGIGREKAADYKSHNKVNHKSVGMEVTKERLELINKTKKANLSVKIIDLKDENGQPQGTRVEIFVPVK